MKQNADVSRLWVAFLGYLIFTLYMRLASTQTNKVLLIIFILIDFLFLCLTLSSFNIAYELSHKLAAVSEMLIAIVSFYGSAACVINGTFGRKVLPQGAPINFKA